MRKQESQSWQANPTNRRPWQVDRHAASPFRLRRGAPRRRIFALRPLSIVDNSRPLSRKVSRWRPTQLMRSFGTSCTSQRKQGWTGLGAVGKGDQAVRQWGRHGQADRRTGGRADRRTGGRADRPKCRQAHEAGNWSVGRGRATGGPLLLLLLLIISINN